MYRSSIDFSISSNYLPSGFWSTVMKTKKEPPQETNFKGTTGWKHSWALVGGPKMMLGGPELCQTCQTLKELLNTFTTLWHFAPPKKNRKHEDENKMILPGFIHHWKPVYSVSGHGKLILLGLRLLKNVFSGLDLILFQSSWVLGDLFAFLAMKY